MNELTLTSPRWIRVVGLEFHLGLSEEFLQEWDDLLTHHHH